MYAYAGVLNRQLYSQLIRRDTSLQNAFCLLKYSAINYNLFACPLHVLIWSY